MEEDNNHSTALRRRNSIPSAVLIPTSNANHHDFRLLPLPPAAYTSLKDILPPSPSSMLSPTPVAAASSSPAAATNGGGGGGTGSCYEISIRNRLVKQAAWAYLNSAVASEPSSSRRLCFSGEFFRRVFVGFGQLVIDTVRRVYEWLVDALWLLLCR